MLNNPYSLNSVLPGTDGFVGVSHNGFQIFPQGTVTEIRWSPVKSHHDLKGIVGSCVQIRHQLPPSICPLLHLVSCRRAWGMPLREHCSSPSTIAIQRVGFQSSGWQELIDCLPGNSEPDWPCLTAQSFCACGVGLGQRGYLRRASDSPQPCVTALTLGHHQCLNMGPSAPNPRHLQLKLME